MIGLGTLTKLMRGGLGQDALGELLAQMGIEASFEAVTDGREAFGSLAIVACTPGAKLLQFTGMMGDGDQVRALMVVTPKQTPAGASSATAAHN